MSKVSIDWVMRSGFGVHIFQLQINGKPRRVQYTLNQETGKMEYNRDTLYRHNDVLEQVNNIIQRDGIEDYYVEKISEYDKTIQ